jgi:hypothetical protein
VPEHRDAGAGRPVWHEAMLWLEELARSAEDRRARPERGEPGEPEARRTTPGMRSSARACLYRLIGGRAATEAGMRPARGMSGRRASLTAIDDRRRTARAPRPPAPPESRASRRPRRRPRGQPAGTGRSRRRAAAVRLPRGPASAPRRRAPRATLEGARVGARLPPAPLPRDPDGVPRRGDHLLRLADLREAGPPGGGPGPRSAQLPDQRRGRHGGARSDVPRRAARPHRVARRARLLPARGPRGLQGETYRYPWVVRVVTH